MNTQALKNRVEIPERTVEGLAELPDRMGALESQVSQLRTEMRVEFSAVRTEMRQLNEETRDGLRQEMRQVNEETRRELRGRIEDLGTHMRVLHEEVISRIALLDEHTNGPSRIRHPPTGQPRTKRHANELLEGSSHDSANRSR